MTLNATLIPILAASFGPIGVIIFLLMFGGHIYGMIAKAKEKARKQNELGGDKPEPSILDRVMDAIEQAKQSQDPSSRPSQRAMTGDMQERLERMRREANASRQSSSEDAGEVPVLMQIDARGPSSGSQPSNLTAEQMQLRQRAREEYERRAMELRRQRAAAQTLTANQPSGQPRPSHAPRPAPTSVVTPSPAARTAPARQPLAPAHGASEDPVVMIGSAYEPPPVVDEPQSVPLPSSVQKPQRLSSPAPAAASAPASKPHRTGAVNAATLRKAILWREILDKPLALREMDDRY
jgi:hypothetical protein